MPTFADRGCHAVSVTDPYGRILRFFGPEPLLFLPSSSSRWQAELDAGLLLNLFFYPEDGGDMFFRKVG
jgi:hypothetical protein